MSEQRVYVRVTMSEDGKTPIRTLVVDGIGITEISYIDTLEAAVQFTGSLRWDARKS